MLVIQTCMSQKYDRRYRGNAIITKHSIPEALKEGEMRNKWCQNKRHIWNNRRTNKEELQKRNRLGTISRKLLGGGGSEGRGLNRFYSIDSKKNEQRRFQAFGYSDILSEFICKASITKTRLFKYKKNFTSKNRKLPDHNSDIFHISAQNINLDTRSNRLGKAVLTSILNLCFWTKIRKIMYTPVNPSFTI